MELECGLDPSAQERDRWWENSNDSSVSIKEEHLSIWLRYYQLLKNNTLRVVLLLLRWRETIFLWNWASNGPTIHPPGDAGVNLE
jgi:hypothetical protein